MRVPIALLAFYIAIGLELALRPALAIGEAGPSFVLPLAVFIALFGSRTAALWSALLAGLVLDLARAHGGASGGPPLTIPGPEALSMLAGVGLVLWARHATIRGNPLTMIIMTVLAGLAGALVYALIFTIRTAAPYEHTGWTLSDLPPRFLSALLSALTAAAMTLILFPLMPLFRFDDSHGRRFVFARGA